MEVPLTNNVRRAAARTLGGLFVVLLLCGEGAAEVACVAQHSADLRNGLSRYAPVLLEVPQRYPLEVLEREDGSLRVRDYKGRNGWVDASSVTPSRCAVVSRDRVNVRAGPGTSHPITFKAEEGVAFEVLEEMDRWFLLRHESGKTGWIFGELLWGVQ